MDNQHEMIKGYRDLSQAEVDLINKIKVHAKVIGELVQEVEYHLSKTCIYTQSWYQVDKEGNRTGVEGEGAMPAPKEGRVIGGPSDETKRWASAEPFGWTSRAKDDLQDGFMKLTRAVAQPTTF